MRVTLFQLILLCSVSASAQVHVLKESDGLSIVGKNMMAYEDKTASLTFNEISQPQYLKKFKPAEGDLINRNVSHAINWIHIRFFTNEDKEWYMESAVSSIEKLDVYQFVHGKLYHQRAGIKYPRDKRTLVGHRNIFRLYTIPGDTIDCFIRYEDATALKLTVKAGTLTSFFEHDHTFNYLHGAYMGIVLIMVLYNLFLYATNRHRVYLYYVLYVIFSFMFILFFTGHMIMMPEWYVTVFTFSPVFVAATFGAFGLLFTMEFLMTKTNAPVMHKLMVYFIFMVTVPVTVSLFGYKHLSIEIIQIAGFALALLSISTSIIVYRRGYKPAKYYILGFGAYMFGLIMLILSNIVGFDSEYLAVNSLEAGSGMEAILLSFAIGDKLNTANKDKNAAREEAIKVAQENEKLVREQNMVLEQKVHERTSELKEQKELVEEKQKEVMDSIAYAKRIQDAYLPPVHVLKYFFKESFLLFKPKDIVSGDFYWYYCKQEEDGTRSDTVFMAVADCTGHGVPGAIMSVICCNALNEAVITKGISDTGEILNEVREIVIRTLKSSNEGKQKDGMDISLVQINRKSREVQFSGANNPLWIVKSEKLKVRSDGDENEENSSLLTPHFALHEVRADKQPVGIFTAQTAFTAHSLQLSKGDMVYLFSDGYADQFGGPKGKKFKYSSFKALLEEVHHLAPDDQRDKLEVAFNTWKGELEQVDDVCIIGVRV